MLTKHSKKAIWHLINKEKKHKTNNGLTVSLDPEEINEHFVKAGIYTPDNTISLLKNMNICKSFYFQPISEEEVRKTIRNMKDKKVKDIYGLSTNLLMQALKN